MVTTKTAKTTDQTDGQNLPNMDPRLSANYCVYLMHKCIADALSNNWPTTAPCFVTDARGVIAGLYPMIVIVRCRSTGQVLVLDGWMLTMGGQGVICARKLTVLSER